MFLHCGRAMRSMSRSRIFLRGTTNVELYPCDGVWNKFTAAIGHTTAPGNVQFTVEFTLHSS